MKKIILQTTLLLLVSFMFFSGCKKDKKEEPTPTDPTKTSVTLTGNVIDINSTPLAGVTVKVGTVQTTTSSDGSFYLSNVTVSSSRFTVEFSLNGYFTLVRSAIPTAGEKYDIEVGLISETDFTYAGSASFASNTAGNLTMGNGCVIDFPANAFITSSGAPFSGTVNVKAAYLDPTMNNYPLFVFGGDLYAKDSLGTDVMINPYAGLNVVITDGVDKLQLDTANSVNAQVQFNIPTTLITSAPNTIELFDFDENNGECYANGTANKTGGKYVGQVQHFSFWNCAEYHPGKALISGYVKDQNGTPIPGIPVRIGHTFAKTDVDGYYHKIVPTGTNILIKILSVQLSNLATPSFINVSPLTDGGTATADFTISGLKKITGRIINCAGAPIQGKVLLSWYSNLFYTNVNTSCFTKSNGIFELFIDSAYSVTMHIWANNTDTITSFTPSYSNPYNLGNITICPPIQTGPNKATVSGVTYNFNSSKIGFMIFDTVPAPKHISIAVYATDGSFFAIQTNGTTTGQYIVDGSPNPSVLSMNIYSTGFQEPITNATINITRLDAVGGLIEGNFSGTSATGAVVSGQFSVPRMANQYN